MFQRLYGLIKYKTLPSSFLFKNRLFIERDSKNKRILSNFGLSFRNSKWGNYELNNIQLSFKLFFLKFISIFIFIIVLVFVLYWKNYYLLFYFYNNISFFFWINLDSFDYYLIFINWIFFSFFFSLTHLIYSYFFFNYFSTKFASKNNTINYLQSTNSINFTKNDLKYTLYSWLVNNQLSEFQNIKNKISSQLFEINNLSICTNTLFFNKLFNSVFFLNLMSSKFDFIALKTSINAFTVFNSYSRILPQLNLIKTPQHLTLFFYFFINKKTIFNEKNDLVTNRYSNLNNKYNLTSLNTEITNNKELIKFKNSIFFLHDLTSNYLTKTSLFFNENRFMDVSTLSTFTAAKWDRWLYRYSLLHRKSIKTAHKFTLTKRLLNSGIFDLKLNTNNIWASEYLNKYNNLNNLFDNYFPSYFINKIKNTQFNSTSVNFFENSNLIFLNSLENTYFWNLKRIYFFNNLNTNKIKSSYFFNIKKNKTFDNNFKVNKSVDFFLKNFILNFSLWTNFDKKLFLLPISKNDPTALLIKDINPIYSDNDLFLKSDLFTLLSITNQSTFSNLQFFIYNFKNINTLVHTNFYNDLLVEDDLLFFSLTDTYDIANVDFVYMLQFLIDNTIN